MRSQHNNPTPVSNYFNSITDFSISPNPNNGVFQIKKSNNLEVKIEIIDAIGQKLFSAIKSEQSKSYDLSYFPKGIYFPDFDTF